MTCWQVSTSVPLMRATASSSQSTTSTGRVDPGSSPMASRMSPNSAHKAGFRDCGLVALDYLTNVARLDPSEPVVVGVKRLVERGCAAPADSRRRRRRRPAVTEAGVDRRQRMTADQENRLPTAMNTCDPTDASSPATTTTTTYGFRSRFISASVDNSTVHGHGRLALGENRLPLPRASPAKRSSRCGNLCRPSDDTTTADVESLKFCSPFNRNHADIRRRPQIERRSLKLDGDVSRLAVHGHLSARPETLSCDDETSTTSTVVECARILDGLARRDSRVENLLTELMDLMDEESDECTEL